MTAVTEQGRPATHTRMTYLDALVEGQLKKWNAMSGSS